MSKKGIFSHWLYANYKIYNFEMVDEATHNGLHNIGYTSKS